MRLPRIRKEDLVDCGGSRGDLRWRACAIRPDVRLTVDPAPYQREVLNAVMGQFLRTVALTEAMSDPVNREGLQARPPRLQASILRSLKAAWAAF